MVTIKSPFTFSFSLFVLVSFSLSLNAFFIFIDVAKCVFTIKLIKKRKTKHCYSRISMNVLWFNGVKLLINHVNVHKTALHYQSIRDKVINKYVIRTLYGCFGIWRNVSFYCDLKKKLVKPNCWQFNRTIEKNRMRYALNDVVNRQVSWSRCRLWLLPSLSVLGSM